MLADWLAQGGQADSGQDAFLFTPLLVAKQVVLEAAKLHAGATHDVAGLQPVAYLLVDEELVAVGDQPFGAAGILAVDIALEADGDPARREALGVQVFERTPVGEGAKQKLHRL